MQATDVKEFFQLPFIQVALPIMITFAFALFYQNKRMDDLGKRIDDLKDGLGKRIDDLRSDMNRQFAEVNRRLDRIETKLDNHESRITALEERTSLVRK